MSDIPLLEQFIDFDNYDDAAVLEANNKLIDALYKHSDELKKQVKELKVTMRHASIFIRSRQKMHPVGIELYDELLND